MRTASPTLARKFRNIAARMGAAFREQRAIEAQRALQRYRHLLERPHETLSLNEIIQVWNEEDTSENAHGTDARECATGQRTLERA